MEGKDSKDEEEKQGRAVDAFSGEIAWCEHFEKDHHVRAMLLEASTFSTCHCVKVLL